MCLKRTISKVSDSKAGGTAIKQQGMLHSSRSVNLTAEKARKYRIYTPKRHPLRVFLSKPQNLFVTVCRGLMKKYTVYLREIITLTRQTVTNHVRFCKCNKLFQIWTEIGIIDETEGFLITALCVMKAYEKEIINIDAPINHYLSHWKLCTTSGNESDASIRMVLCHVAGIVDGEDAFYGLRRTDPAIGLMDILEGRTSYNNRPAHVEKAPGTEFEYSDAGYCVLQLLLKEITGKLFEDIAKENIFDPLGLGSK